MNAGKCTLIGVVLIVFLGARGALFGNTTPCGFDCHRHVAHALGGIGESTNTNAREAFIYNYLLGMRLFEVDLRFTKDSRLVAFHDDDMEELLGISGDVLQLSEEEFLKQNIHNKYTPLSLTTLLKLLQMHRDAFIITDTKDATLDMLTILVARVKEVDPALLDRIVPQFYQIEEFVQINRIHPFPQILFTLHRANATDEEVLRFVEGKDQIIGVVIPLFRYSPEFVRALRERGKNVYVHTVNDAEEIRQFLSKGVTGVYTDRAFPTFYGWEGISKRSQ